MKILSIGQSEPHGKKLFSEAIKFVERSDHSHIFITWKDEDLEVRKVAEARGSGGKMVSNKEFRRVNKVVNLFQYEVSEDQLILVEKWLWDNIGAYGKKGILGLTIMRAQMLVNKILPFKIFKPGNPFKDGTHSQICCEMALRVMKIVGYKFDEDIEDFGLYETNIFLRESGSKVPQEKIDRINDKK